MSITQEEMNNYLKLGDKAMDDALTHLHDELVKIRTGKASPAILSGLLVNYYGSPTPLSQIANVSTADSRTLSIQAWDKKALPDIEKAIFEANLGFTPQNDGELIRINIPPLTEERRLQLVKHAKHLGEEAKVSLRNARHKLMDFVKKAVKDGYPEDAGKKIENRIQQLTDSHGEKVNKMVEAKNADIMKV